MTIGNCRHGYGPHSGCPVCKGWIDCTVEMPKADGRYLVAELICSSFWIGVCSLRHGAWDSSSVKYWQALPEPPLLNNEVT